MKHFLIISALAISWPLSLDAAFPNPAPRSQEARIHQLEQELAVCRAATEVRHQAASENKPEGTLAALTADVVLARPLNMAQSIPGAARGIVVVNCLVGTKGKVLAVRMLQPLPGTSYEVKEINEASLETAKRLVFEPATSADGKIRYQVWQGVGFLIPAKR